MVDYAVMGKRIKAERKRKGLTQTEMLAEIYLSEKSVASLRSWENGVRAPSVSDLDEMARLFDCDVAYLLGESSDRHWKGKEVFEYTGISAKAADHLHHISQDRYIRNAALPLLSEVIKTLDFDSVARWMADVGILNTTAFWKQKDRHAEIEIMSDGTARVPTVDANKFIVGLIVKEFEKRIEAAALRFAEISVISDVMEVVKNNAEKIATRERDDPQKDSNPQG